MRALIDLIKSDLYRYEGSYSMKNFFRAYCFIPGFRFSVYFRITSELKENRFAKPLYYCFLLRCKILSRKYGIQIYPGTTIGKGFYIGHFGTIVVSQFAILGDNVNISQGVTIGMANRGEKKGAPIIGDCVYIGPGAKIVGRVNIGNNVCIGANAVVTKDIPDDAVVGGVPASVISFKGTNGYINRIV